MDVKIEKFRVSFIWTVLLKDPMNGIPLPQMPYLTDKQGYAGKFRELVDNDDESDGISLPWSQKSGSKHNFWSYYLGTNIPFADDSIRDADCVNIWNGCVPFRRRVDLPVDIDDEDASIKLTGYFNSFSLTLLATIEKEGEFSVTDLWNTVFEMKETQIFLVDGQDRDYTIHEIAPLAFNELLSFASGQEGYKKISAIPRDPFTIVSILKGSEIDEVRTKNILTREDFNELRYTLHDLTCWKNELFPDRANNPDLPAPEQVLISNKLQPMQGDIFYRQRRGRAIWIPRYFENTHTGNGPDRAATNGEKRRWKNMFIMQKRNQKKIACFHNNILFLSIQLESFCLFVKELDLAFQDKARAQALSSDIDDWARRVIKNLSNLYLGRDENIAGDLATDKTYRSISSRLHTNDNNAFGSLNSLRNRYNLKSLTGTP
jgi:hypothetical protein